MRKIVLYIATSLDGFIASKDGGIDWLFTDNDYGYYNFLETVDTILMGRKTYEQVLTFGDWPYKEKNSYIFSRRKTETENENVIFHNDPVRAARKLKAGEGRDIWLVGGAELNRVLFDAVLVDELIVSVHPVLLGGGIPLMGKLKSEQALSHKKTVEFESGLVQLYYDVEK